MLSAGTAARRQQMREPARALARTADWALISATLSRRGLTPMLGGRLLELCPGPARERFASEVAISVTSTRRRGALQALVSEHLRQSLAQAGIRSLALKGTFLAEAVYGDPGLRGAADIDLLVAPGDLSAALAVVRRAGYGAPRDHVARDGLPLLHYTLTDGSGRLPALDLHWRVHWYEQRFSSDMLARAGRDDHWGLRAGALDELVSLLLFYARDGFLGLRLACDLARWWDRLGDRLSEGALGEVIGAYPALGRALSAAADAAERVAGLPGSWLLGGQRRADLRTRLATRLANPGARGNPAQCSADAGLVDWLLVPRGGQREFIRRQLLPPRAVLAERSRVRAERRITTVGHGARVLGRYGLTMARLTGPRER
jgi:Uncharacterised nucleotidyltransferase